MKTKVSNCGNYECAHCNAEGHCGASSISINKDGKCIIFRKSSYKTIPIKEVHDEISEHTNMC